MEFNRLKMLDEQAIFAGLGLTDIAALGVALVLLSSFFKLGTSKLLIWPIVLVIGVGLIGVRRGRRSGVIRSFLKSKIRSRTIYDPKHV